jgi:hypothetical protein
MKTQWHAKNHHLIATRGIASVSVEVPIDGFFYDARNWLEAFRHCITVAEAKLAVEEWRARA